MHMLNLAVKSDCDKLQYWPNYEFIDLLYNITTTALIVQILYRDLCVVWWFTDSQGGVGDGGTGWNHLSFWWQEQKGCIVKFS